MTESAAIERFERRRATVAASRPPSPPAVSKVLVNVASEIALKPRAPVDVETCECGGRGWAVAQDGGVGTAKPCICRSQRPVEELLAAAGVWERYRHCTRETWDSTWATWPAKALANFPEPHSTLTVFGLVGAGKTHLATAVLADRLRAGKPGMWRDVSATLAEIKRGFSSGNAEALTAQLCSPRHLLALDDLYAEQSTDWSESLLSYVLRHRHGRRLPTIITANVPDLLKLDDIEPRLSSRCGEGALVRLSGPDRRTERRTS